MNACNPKAYTIPGCDAMQADLAPQAGVLPWELCDPDDGAFDASALSRDRFDRGAIGRSRPYLAMLGPLLEVLANLLAQFVEFVEAGASAAAGGSAQALADHIVSSLDNLSQAREAAE